MVSLVCKYMFCPFGGNIHFSRFSAKENWETSVKGVGGIPLIYNFSWTTLPKSSIELFRTVKKGVNTYLWIFFEKRGGGVTHPPIFWFQSQHFLAPFRLKFVVDIAQNSKEFHIVEENPARFQSCRDQFVGLFTFPLPRIRGVITIPLPDMKIVKKNWAKEFYT